MYRICFPLIAALILPGCSDQAAPPNAGPVPSSVPDSTNVVSNDTTSAEVAADVPELTEAQADFGTRWKAANEADRRGMADLGKVQPLFQGASKGQVKAALGAATESGVDKFGTDVMRYELGAAPEADGGGQYHLTFVFENDVVTATMGNVITFSP